MSLDLSQLPHAEIEALCREHHIRRLALFGSALRDDFSADSDVDVLVEFEPSARIGLAFFRLQDEGNRVLVTRGRLRTQLTIRCATAPFSREPKASASKKKKASRQHRIVASR